MAELYSPASSPLLHHLGHHRQQGEEHQEAADRHAAHARAGEHGCRSGERRHRHPGDPEQQQADRAQHGGRNPCQAPERVERGDAEDDSPRAPPVRRTAPRHSAPAPTPARVRVRRPRSTVTAASMPPNAESRPPRAISVNPADSEWPPSPTRAPGSTPYQQDQHRQRSRGPPPGRRRPIPGLERERRTAEHEGPAPGAETSGRANPRPAGLPRTGPAEQEAEAPQDRRRQPQAGRPTGLPLDPPQPTWEGLRA